MRGRHSLRWGIPPSLLWMTCLERWLMKAAGFCTRGPLSATLQSTLATAASPRSARWPRAYQSAALPSSNSRRVSFADTPSPPSSSATYPLPASPSLGSTRTWSPQQPRRFM